MNFKKIFKDQGIYIGLLILIIFGAITSDVFISVTNVFNVLRQTSILGIMALGMTFVLIGGDFDLSVGSTFSLCGLIAISLQPYGLIISILAVIVVGILIGFLNGFLITKFKASPFIITLGTMTLIQAIALIYTGGKNVLGDPGHLYSFIGRGRILNIPFPIILFLILTIVLNIILKHTKFGYALYATGGNKKAAYYSGIRTSLVRKGTFILSSLTTSIGAIIMSSRLASAQPTAGQGYELDIIGAVIIGGTSLFGGSGSVYKTIGGVLFLALFNNIMILLNINYPLQVVSKGIVILLAVWLDIQNRRGNNE